MNANAVWWSTLEGDSDVPTVGPRALRALLGRLPPRPGGRATLIADGAMFLEHATPLAGPFDGYVALAGAGPLPDLRGWPGPSPTVPAWPPGPVLPGGAATAARVVFPAPDRRRVRPFTAALPALPLSLEVSVRLSSPELGTRVRLSAGAPGPGGPPGGSRLAVSAHPGGSPGPDVRGLVEAVLARGALAEDQMARKLAGGPPPGRPDARPAAYVAASGGAAVRALGRLCDPDAGFGLGWSASDLYVGAEGRSWARAYDGVRAAAQAAPLGEWQATTYVTAEFDPAALPVLAGSSDHFLVTVRAFTLGGGEPAVLQVGGEGGRPGAARYTLHVAVFAEHGRAQPLADTFLRRATSDAPPSR